MAERLTRRQAIRAKCLDCSGGNRAEVRHCPSNDCPLWPYRLGAEQKNTGADEAEPEEQTSG